MVSRCYKKVAGLWFVMGMISILATTQCISIPDILGPGDPGLADLNVTGTYRYSGLAPFFNLSGTITFEQDGDTVRVTRTTYDAGTNRPVVGEGTLVGNVLDIDLVPENGDTDYRADVEFIFDETGDSFSVAFSDTNNDAGGQGSFSGQRTSQSTP